MAPKVTPVIDAPRVSSANTGVAPAIRRMKMRYPELSEGMIAKRVGCDPANVHRVLKRFLGDGITEQDHEDFKNNTADVFDRMTHRMLMSITDADIEKAQLLPRVTSAAILHDKARTIRGQATQVNVSVLLDLRDAIRDMRERQP
jgi:AraC-like DNA-binding protein